MAWQSSTINPATTSPATDITKITNDLSVLKSVINGGTDVDVPSKSVLLDTATGAASIPAGDTAQRPGTPTAGQFRFNSTTVQFEGYNGSAWGAVGGGATGGVGNAAFYENDTTVTANYTITTNKNAMTAGPITVNNGVTVTVPNGSAWTII